MRPTLLISVISLLASACGGTSAVTPAPASPPVAVEPTPVEATDDVAPETQATHPLAGNWSGATDSGTLFLVLEAATPTAVLSGNACTAAGKDCHPLEKVSYTDGTLQFQYQWQEGTESHKATARLVTAPSGDMLDGGLYTTKCSCTKPARLVRAQ